MSKITNDGLTVWHHCCHMETVGIKGLKAADCQMSGYAHIDWIQPLINCKSLNWQHTKLTALFSPGKGAFVGHCYSINSNKENTGLSPTPRPIGQVIWQEMPRKRHRGPQSNTKRQVELSLPNQQYPNLQTWTENVLILYIIQHMLPSQTETFCVVFELYLCTHCTGLLYCTILSYFILVF